MILRYTTMEWMVCMQMIMLSWIFVVQKRASIPTKDMVFVRSEMLKSTFICLPNTIQPMTMHGTIDFSREVVPSRTSTPTVHSHTRSCRRRRIRLLNTYHLTTNSFLCRCCFFYGTDATYLQFHQNHQNCVLLKITTRNPLNPGKGAGGGFFLLKRHEEEPPKKSTT